MCSESLEWAPQRSKAKISNAKENKGIRGDSATSGLRKANLPVEQAKRRQKRGMLSVQKQR